MPQPDSPEASRPPASVNVVVLLAGIVLVGMLVVLIAVLASLEGTRSELRTTRMEITEAEQRSQRLTERVEPLLDAATPLIDRQSQQSLRQTGRTVSEAAGQVAPLAEDAHRGVGVAEFIAQTLQTADLPPALAAVRALTDAAVPATRQFTPALAALQAELGRGGTRSLASCDRRLAASAPAAPGQIACLLRTVPNVRALLKRQRDLNAKLLTTQQGTLSYNRRIYGLFVESLRIQREILQRTRSLDTKTGGPAPGTPASP